MRSKDKSMVTTHYSASAEPSSQLVLGIEPRKVVSKQKLCSYYMHLTKPTISLLVTLSALPAYLIPQTAWPPVIEVLGLLLGVYLMSASAAVFNQLLEWETDRTMMRTRGRSVPMGYVSRGEAGWFGALVGVVGIGALLGTVGQLTALIGLGGHVFYVVIYTLILKKLTVQNIVIGGAAGAIGPLMGAAAAGQLASPLPWILFALIFLWTPPHFWSLSLKYQSDYAAAGIPMFPVVYGEDRTRKMIFLYSLTLIPVVLLLAITGLWLATTVAILITGYFVYLCADLYKHKKQSHHDLMRLFRWSCYYALVIFSVLSLEKILRLWLIG